MGQTKIEWTDKVWNPITGCSFISDGCRNCYARRMAYRLKGRYGYPEDDPFRVTFHLDRLKEPSHWRKRSRVFVCSMGDLFHEDVGTDDIQTVFDYMNNAGWHTFFLLTKRPNRMANVVSHIRANCGFKWMDQPWEHIWLGVSVEDQKTADERIPILLQIPVAHRFVSDG
jgi:protein gp37